MTTSQLSEGKTAAEDSLHASDNNDTIVDPTTTTTDEEKGGQSLEEKGEVDMDSTSHDEEQSTTENAENDNDEDNEQDGDDESVVVSNDTEFLRDMEGGKSNILVAVRVRPFLSRDAGKNVIDILDEKVVLLKHEHKSRHDFLRANRSKQKQYAFDYAFSDKCPTEYVYTNTTRFLIGGVVNGYNATVFAYGATGAGKTHTMLGTETDPGIMFLTLQDLFLAIEEREDKKYTVSLSYLEVYNENIRDLLNPSPDFLDLREDPVKGMIVSGITELKATSADDVMAHLHAGNNYRTTEPTAANKVSSRSHAVLQVIVEQRDKTGDTEQKVRVGKLSLIDLAGSERASVTQNSGIRMVEGANINRSLLALANCINALGQKTPGVFVPYRDSKLTRLLKDSLGGNCRTVMIANISPCSPSFEETHNTLKYANRAKNIKTSVARNVLNVTYHIAQYTRIIKDLRGEISELKRSLRQANSHNGGGGGGGGRQIVRSKRNESLQDLRGAENIRTEIIQRFEEMIEIKRSLVDIQEEAIQNKCVIDRLKVTVDSYTETHPSSSPDEYPDDIRVAHTNVLELEEAVKKNEEAADSLTKHLTETQNDAQHMMKDLSNIIRNKQLRAMLELEYHVHCMEVSKMEHEEAAFLHETMVMQRDLDIGRLEHQLEIRDAYIRERSGFLEEKSLKYEDVEVKHPDYISLEQLQADFMYRNRYTELVSDLLPHNNTHSGGGGALPSGIDASRVSVSGTTRSMRKDGKEYSSTPKLPSSMNGAGDIPYLELTPAVARSERPVMSSLPAVTAALETNGHGGGGDVSTSESRGRRKGHPTRHSRQPSHSKINRTRRPSHVKVLGTSSQSLKSISAGVGSPSLSHSSGGDQREKTYPPRRPSRSYGAIHRVNISLSPSNGPQKTPQKSRGNRAVPGGPGRKGNGKSTTKRTPSRSKLPDIGGASKVRGTHTRSKGRRPSHSLGRPPIGSKSTKANSSEKSGKGKGGKAPISSKLVRLKAQKTRTNATVKRLQRAYGVKV